MFIKHVYTMSEDAVADYVEHYGRLRIPPFVRGRMNVVYVDRDNTDEIHAEFRQLNYVEVEAFRAAFPGVAQGRCWIAKLNDGRFLCGYVSTQVFGSFHLSILLPTATDPDEAEKWILNRLDQRAVLED